MEDRYIIYGIGRVQRDFEYIFDNVNIAGYLIDKKNGEMKEWNNNPLYEIKDIKLLCDYKIIICDFDKYQKKDELEKYELVYQKDFWIADDFFERLDLKIESLSKGRRIFVWGTGVQAKILNDENVVKSDVVGYIDNDIKKNDSILFGKKVISPDRISEHMWKDIFIVVATDAFFDIRIQLEEKGLLDGIDFIWSKLLINRPSSLLKKTIYDRGMYNLTCDTMLNTYEIESTGEVACCCTTFVNERIGNLVRQDFKEIWRSIYHKILCLSVANKTYTFCKKDMCPVLMEKKRHLYEENYSKFEPYKNIEASPKVMLISIDGGCNLYCESCRNGLTFLAGKEKEDANLMVDKLLRDDNLRNAEFIVMAGNGEVFLNKTYERLWSDEKTKHVKRFRLLSNGTLFTPLRWEKFSEGRTSEVVVTFSIDAATEETYSQIRRGGNFKQLLKNLEFAAELRKRGELHYFQISFVVQRKNYKEMPLFVELGKKLGVDKVFFTRILNWGTYSKDEFEEISMTQNDGSAKTELQEILSMPIMQEKIVDLGTINSKSNEKEYDYIYNYYLWEIDRYLERNT